MKPPRRGRCANTCEAKDTWESDQLDVMGYWRSDADAWARRYARVGADLFVAYQRDIAAGKPEKVAAEEFDAALSRPA